PVATPLMSILTTRPATPGSASTRFDPPPSTCTSRRRASAHSRASHTARSSGASTKYRAGPPTSMVQWEASATFSSGFTGMISAVIMLFVVRPINRTTMSDDREREREPHDRRRHEEHDEAGAAPGILPCLAHQPAEHEPGGRDPDILHR